LNVLAVVVTVAVVVGVLDASPTASKLLFEALEIADLYIDDIRADDIREWIDELRAKRYAPGKGTSTNRKGPKVWAYSKGTIRGYYRAAHDPRRRRAPRTRVTRSASSSSRRSAR
jgi:hypothetical protein